MKKDRKEGEMQRTLLRGILGLLLFFLLTGCGFNINSRIGPLLTPEYLDKQVSTESIDLSMDGQCPDVTLSVIPVNVETRTDKYRVYDTMVTHYFRPKAFIDHAVDYMKKRMVQSNLVVDEQKGEKILVSLEEASSYGNWTLETNIKLKIEIPRIDYSQIYSGVEGSAYQQNASAYALHIAIMKFLKDPVFQKFVKCQ